VSDTRRIDSIIVGLARQHAWETPREQLPYMCKADMVAFLDKAARVLVEGVDVRQVAENIISLFSLLAGWSRPFVIDSGNPVASNNEEVPHGR
jgi:hypothetical protein